MLLDLKTNKDQTVTNIMNAMTSLIQTQICRDSIAIMSQYLLQQ